MTDRELIAQIIGSRKSLVMHEVDKPLSQRKMEAEGGCGVIGIACSDKIAGRHLLQALTQMRNRGNGKGGGIAAVGLIPQELGVTREVLERDHLLAIAYLEPSMRSQVEKTHIHPTFEVDHVGHVPTRKDFRELKGLEIQPPDVYYYFVRVKADVSKAFQASHKLERLSRHSIEDEIVYQNTFSLNRAYYASTGEKRAFVLSHGKNLLVLKMVSYGDDVVRYYKLEDLHAHVWIGHHRYPTKGKVWHPGGAHPFVGLHEALVHNGDFANYASITTYLAQRNIHPLFLTDTEVSVLVFDLLHRIYDYPLEYVIESLAPTTERDFTLLSADKQRIYQMLQTVHIHGSPDGPWFFLIAQSVPQNGVPTAYRLIGITDTSMLRPQVFALQSGEETIGFAASEKQGIDAALESLSCEDARFWGRADRYWNARGGSHTDGGAFLFTVHAHGEGKAKLICEDKFGRRIEVDQAKKAYGSTPGVTTPPTSGATRTIKLEGTAREVFERATRKLPSWNYEDVLSFLKELEASAHRDCDRGRAIEVLTRLMDLRYPTGSMRRSRLLALYDQSFAAMIEDIRKSPSEAFVYTSIQGPHPEPGRGDQTLVIDARGYAPEGEKALSLEIVRQYRHGFRKFLIAHTKGHRFIANGLGAGTRGIRVDVYGSSGDYLASGIDGAEVYVHGNAQDQLAQIMKDGRLVVHGDVGQTFMYAAKGGQAFILGNAAGRPLINAVGKPRVVINGTCLDYLAESFMAGDPLNGGGFVILNGITFDEDGEILELDTPYPGGNLFSLASGGAIYVRDPHGRVTEDQLNGGEFAELSAQDWAVIKPYLEENERLFGIPVERLLQVEGQPLAPKKIYRKIKPRAVRALQAEEAWVRKHE
jgi:glutamate synthase domain-containing protein 1/glutamate synthase domain-containing protein 3